MQTLFIHWCLYCILQPQMTTFACTPPARADASAAATSETILRPRARLSEVDDLRRTESTNIRSSRVSGNSLSYSGCIIFPPAWRVSFFSTVSSKIKVPFSPTNVMYFRFSGESQLIIEMQESPLDYQLAFSGEAEI